MFLHNMTFLLKVLDDAFLDEDVFRRDINLNSQLLL